MSKTFRRKDPKKVAAGRKGGRLSGGNFKRNRDAAVMAGQKSAWNRSERQLGEFPLPLITPDGDMTPLNDPSVPPRKVPPLRRRAGV